MKQIVEEKIQEPARRSLFLILAILVSMMQLFGNRYGPNISNIATFLFPIFLQVIFIGLMLRYIKGRVPYKIPGYVLAVGGLWLGLSVWSTLTGGYLMISVVEQAEWLLLMMFAVSATYYFSGFPEDRQRMIRFSSFGFAGYFLLLLIFIYLVPDPKNYDWVSGLPGFSNVRHFGIYAAITLLMSYGQLLKKEFNWRSQDGVATILLIFIGWTALVWAGGRAPFFALAATFICLLAFRLVPEWRRLLILTLVIAPAAVISAEIIKVPNPSFGLEHLIGTLERIGQEDGLNLYSSSRFDFWFATLEAIREKPFFGYGPGMFRYVTIEPMSLFAHPHNSILQFLLAWGLFGAVAIFSIIGLAVCRAYHQLRAASVEERPIRLTAFAVMLLILALSLLDGALFHLLPLLFFVIATSMAVAPVRMAMSPNASQPSFRIQAWVWGFLIAALLPILVYSVSLSMYGSSRMPNVASWRVKTAEFFPAALRIYPTGIIYGRWIDRWIENGEPGVEEKILRAMDKSPGTWVKTLMVARLAEVRGDFAGATEALQPLLSDSHPVIQMDAKAIQSRICDRHGICPEFSTEFE